MTKVWPIKPSLQGKTTHCYSQILQPGVPGWMDDYEAQNAERLGQGQIMHGLTPSHLRHPEYPETPAPRGGRTAAMQAEAPEDLDSVSDEEPDNPEEPVDYVQQRLAEKRKKVAPRKKTAYKRRDLNAEPPGS